MELKFHKVNALPGSLDANAIYMVANAGWAETYVTDQSGVAKSVGNSAMINSLIATALAGLSATRVVATITARNALVLTANTLVYVVDATGDNTVTAGAASYLWDQPNSAWHKISEFESLDVILSWTNIVGKPTSTPNQIDTAVTNSHTHANKATLDLVTVSGGVLQYNGDAVKNWNTLNW